MLLQDIWTFFKSSIFAFPSRREGSTPLFNPYHYADPLVDRSGAAQIRRENLRSYLGSFTARPEVLVVGEAPGWRGCRFSGVPFTSEALLTSGWLAFSGAQSSLASLPYKEATATVFWQALRPYHPAFFAWNCLPFHPHQPGKPLSNRHPALKEIDEHLFALINLNDCLQPRQVIAIGKTAQAALGRAGISAQAVRHPSHGGAQEFRREIDAIREVFLRQAIPNPQGS